MSNKKEMSIAEAVALHVRAIDRLAKTHETRNVIIHQALTKGLNDVLKSYREAVERGFAEKRRGAGENR